MSIAGGSAGGTEQLLAGMVTKAIGGDPSKVNYVAHSGGGEALITMLSGKVKAGISGISEVSDKIESGDLRPLAVSSPRRLPDVNAPTLKESGVDVELANWRGVMAPDFLAGPQFEQFLGQETKDVQAILGDLGLV